MTKKLKFSQNTKDLPLALIKQVLSLATSGFGLVAALAWNEVVKEAINTFVKPYLPQESTVISLFIYAIIITILAVVVTLNLARIQQRLEKKQK